MSWVRFVFPIRTAQLDETWSQLVDDLEALSPERLVASVLDPAFERAMEPVRRVLELPDRLQELVDVAAEHVPEDAVEQLGRVEVAFEGMLRGAGRLGGWVGAYTGGPSSSATQTFVAQQHATRWLRS